MVDEYLNIEVLRILVNIKSKQLFAEVRRQTSRATETRIADPASPLSYIVQLHHQRAKQEARAFNLPDFAIFFLRAKLQRRSPSDCHFLCLPGSQI